MLAFVALTLVAVAGAYNERRYWKDYYGAGCTAIAAGKKATKDGSTSVTHGNDCPTCDFRVGWVPPQDHPPGSMLPIYMAKNDYPRFVGENSANIYKPKHLEKGFPWTWDETEPMGYIPQVSHTYGYLDGAYGIMNEHQLGMGESTCDARLGPRGVPIRNGGHALFDIAALSRVGLQRCKTARCAIKTMGDLAVEYGFYGGQMPDWTPGPMLDDAEGGETLTINDPEEAWIFHVSPDDTGRSAVWVAQRVPDEHITAITNTFNIGQIDLNNEDEFMASPNIYDVAIRNKFWDPASGVPFDFTQIYRSPKGHSIGNRTLIDRRKWRVFSKVAPSAKFNPYHPNATDDSNVYFPFSVKPDQLLDISDIMELHRDVFQDTPFDMQDAVIAGPWRDPWRAAIPHQSPFNDTAEWEGTFERAITQVWTSYTTVTQSRSWLPDHIGGRVWFGPHDGMTTVFVPIYPGAALVPRSLAIGSLNRVNTDSLWWAVCITSNYMARFYSVALPNVTAAYKDVEGRMRHRAEQAEQAALLAAQRGLGPASSHDVIASLQVELGEFALREWWDFFYRLAGYLHDGTRFTPGVDVQTAGLRYPAAWLKAIGPAGAKKAEWSNAHPDPAFDTSHLVTLAPTSLSSRPSDSASSLTFPLFLVACTFLVGLLFGFVLRPYLDRAFQKDGYTLLA